MVFRRPHTVVLAVLLTLLGSGVAAIAAESGQDSYRAVAYLTMFQVPPQGTHVLPARVVHPESFAAIAKSPTVAIGAAAALGGDATPQRLASETSASVRTNGRSVKISVLDKSPADAARFATAMATSLGKYSQQVTTDEASGPTATPFVTSAAIPQTAQPRSLARDVAIGALIGLLLALLSAKAPANRRSDKSPRESVLA